MKQSIVNACASDCSSSLTYTRTSVCASCVCSCLPTSPPFPLLSLFVRLTRYLCHPFHSLPYEAISLLQSTPSMHTHTHRPTACADSASCTHVWCVIPTRTRRYRLSMYVFMCVGVCLFYVFHLVLIYKYESCFGPSHKRVCTAPPKHPI